VAGRPGPDRALHGGDAAALGIFVALVGAVYFGLFNHDFSVNGLRYAEDVERGVELFHPNHLLPNFLYRGAYLLAQNVGLAGIRAIWIMQTINVCAGLVVAASIVRVGLLGRSRPSMASGGRSRPSMASAGPSRPSMAFGALGLLPGGSRANALLIGALYAFGFAAWNFAEEPDVYILPAAAVAVSLAIIAPRDRLNWRAIVVLAVLAAFAVLTLQQYVFWYPALLLLVRARDLGAARRGKLLALALGIPLACLGAYLLVGVADGQLHSATDVLAWFLGYAWNSQAGFGTYRPAPDLGSRLLGTVLGMGNLVFAYEVILSRVAAIAVIAALLPLLLIAARTAGFLRRAAPGPRRDAMIFALWCLANVAFATWWESRNIEFLFPLWVGALMLAALASAALDRRVLIAAVLLVAGVNLAAAFLPQHDWPARYRVAEALARHEQLAKDDVLVTEELNTVAYLRYFDSVDVRFQPGAVSAAMHASEPVARVRTSLDSALASGARVYTTELDEHGRLREIARWFAPLGRSGYDGAIERDIEVLYRGLDTSEQPVPGARRVRKAPAPR
jgi:hypothetical protein